MAYRCDLGNNQSLFLDYQAGQTIVTVLAASLGQQQQSSSSFQTDIWTAPPQAFQTAAGIVLQLHTTQGEIWLQVQGSSIQLSQPRSTINCQPLPVQQVSASVVTPLPPLKPMQPMQMGNMSMSLQPMEMRMGNMEMRMGSPTTAQFCRQCGASTQPDDRFCSKCGTQLQQ